MLLTKDAFRLAGDYSATQSDLRSEKNCCSKWYFNMNISRPVDLFTSRIIVEKCTWMKRKTGDW